MSAVGRVPRSTYRLQITADFDLYAAAARLGYLRDLGVDWVYLSPILEAEAGSDHGYDVLRHDRVDPARGGAEGLAALSAEAHRLGMGVLVDIVPNHVGVATPVPGTWWWDLLQHGRASAYAMYFDVDWEAGDGRLRLPVVGDDDEAAIEVRDGEVTYHDRRFPMAPGTTSADEQAYELVNWRTADDQLNYRRFFAVNELAAIRVEDPEVFAASHVEIGRWFDEGLVDGLRVDHPDGLRDPEGYLDRLREQTGGAYVLVEKILETGERLSPSWVTAGTTGYDALALVDRVLTDVDGQAALTGLESRLRGDEVDWADLIHGTKRAVADGILGSETRRIVRDASVVEVRGAPAARDASVVEVRGAPATSLEAPEAAAGADPQTASVVEVRGAPATSLETAEAVAGADPQAGAGGFEARPQAASHLNQREATREDPELVDAVAELLACFPVYRSYLPDGLEHLEAAFASARQHRPDLTDALDVLWPVLSDGGHPGALRFQQTSGMVMAKGVEDCAFYRYARLTSLNEVGGDPSEFAEPVAAFHEAMATRQAEWPRAMTCGTTHDTKRGEDVRARIAVLAEIPDVWAAALDKLLALVPLPDAGFGSLLWQAIVGVWGSSPGDVLRERLHGYAEKAMREAGDRTQWTSPDEAYEAAVQGAVDAAFDHADVRRVLETLVQRVVAPGWSNALSAKLISLTMPGVPDVYQGSEQWEQSLVDPDNRRPVDFDAAAAALADSSHPKQALVARALRLRRDRPELFAGYTPVAAEGRAADHLLAFDRGGVITIATRLPVGLADRGGWGDTTLGIAGGRHRVADLLDGAPAALLLTEEL